MLHADHTTTEIVASLCIGVFFIIGGVRNILAFSAMTARLAELRVPFPGFTLIAGFIMQCTGAFMVAFDVYAAAGAITLIVFTVIASLMFYRFWAAETPAQRNMHINFVLANLGVIGGLLLIV